MRAIDQIDLSVRKFLSQYEANINLSTNMLYQKIEPMYFKDLERDTYLPRSYQTKSEPMVEMYIPQHQFQRLVQRDEQLQDLIKGREWEHNMISNMREEERIRDNNPAVRLAWEKYALLLEIARK